MLQPTPLATAVWPVTGDVPELQAIVRAQMATIADQAALIDAYQGVLDAAQAVPEPPPLGAPATGSVTGSGPSDFIVLGQTQGTVAIGGLVQPVIANPVFPDGGVTIMMMSSGTPGGDGIYQIAPPLAGTLVPPVAVTIVPQNPPPSPPSWPVSTDAGDLMLIAQDQTAIIRMQTALMQNYQTLLNDSQTAPPP